MENSIIILVLGIGLCLCVVYLLILYLVSHQLTKEENNLVPMCQTSCGLQIGQLMLYGWPLVRLCIYENSLIIKGWKTHNLKLSNIYSIQVKRPRIFYYLYVSHHDPKVPHPLTIIISPSAKILPCLEKKVKLIK